MGASKSTRESGVGEERFSLSCFDLDSALNNSLDAPDSYIEIDLSSSESAACDADVDAEFEFRVSFSSPLSGYPRQIPADMLFNNGQLLPLHCVTSSSAKNTAFPSPGQGVSTPGSNSTGAGIPKERSCSEVSSCSDHQSIHEAKRHATRWKLLSFRKSSSKVGAENEQSRKAIGKPADDGELMADRVQCQNVGRSAADHAKGVRKLLVKLRPREVGELGWVQKQQGSSPFYHETPRKVDKRMRRAKEMLDRYWRIVNPFKGNRLAEEAESYEGRVFAAAASFGASCRDTGIRSCPTSLGSSPIHRRMNSFVCASRELSVRERDCSLQAAIAHCKKSFGVADGGK
ncbi:uncharacterized protein LOC116261757 [Nymphaea colorata]|nr:uncharacterized protein LOC116261757 [Nymphaea colorata]